MVAGSLSSVSEPDKLCGIWWAFSDWWEWNSQRICLSFPEQPRRGVWDSLCTGTSGAFEKSLGFLWTIKPVEFSECWGWKMWLRLADITTLAVPKVWNLSLYLPEACTVTNMQKIENSCALDIYICLIFVVWYLVFWNPTYFDNKMAHIASDLQVWFEDINNLPLKFPLIFLSDYLVLEQNLETL